MVNRIGQIYLNILTWREKKRKKYTSSKVHNDFFKTMANRKGQSNLNNLTWRQEKKEGYTSAKVRNEFFEIKANIMPGKISENTKISDMVSLIADKTLDVSNNSMLALN